VTELTLCTLNANGIRAAAKRRFRAWLKRTRPDVLALQELRARRDQVPDEVASPPGYDARWLEAEKKGYSGVAVFSRLPVDAYSTGTGLPWSDAEGRFLRADFAAGFSVCSVYFPSGSSGEARQEAKYAFLDHFLGFADGLLADGRPVALCGDLNIAHTELDIWNPKGNAKNSGFLPEERAWLTKLLELGWVDVLRERRPTETGPWSWWSNRGRARELDRGWRIDYTLASPAFAELVTDCWIERKAGLSDHAPVWTRFRAP
jgi:exodeoxyribonuclease-3